jgi:hypothetical protein
VVIDVERGQIVRMSNTKLAVFLEQGFLWEPAILEQIADVVAMALGHRIVRPLVLLVVRVANNTSYKVESGL